MSKEAISYEHPLIRQIIEACGFSLDGIQEFHLHVTTDEPVTAKVKHLVQTGDSEVSTYQFTEVQPVKAVRETFKDDLGQEGTHWIDRSREERLPDGRTGIRVDVSPPPPAEDAKPVERIEFKGLHL